MKVMCTTTMFVSLLAAITYFFECKNSSKNLALQHSVGTIYWRLSKMPSKKLIIDTDIGTDIDDALALVYAVRSGYNIPLITTVHGDTVRRAHIAKKLTRLLGTDIPVAAGEQKPLKQHHLYWYGDEGSDLLASGEKFDVRHDGVESLVD